ncbi:major capsid protein [Sphingomonas sp. R1]|uniref:major capsid protein n=1 Tax=Sphingomonas sp. R1 TaxID=399176 RepID=UPI0022251CE5|nr:major capsid protein [Sphingomonas sp. R1]UYY77499.1 major capsid protein [Sphingomonas sp. R1]
MATTQLLNIIEPKAFDAYARQQTVKKSALITSNVIARMDVMDKHAAAGGAVFEAPHFNPFAWSESNVASDDPSVKSVPANLTAGSQIGRTDYREKDWSVMQLSQSVSGAPILDYAASIVGTYWAHDYQQNVLAKLKGIELTNVASNGGDMVLPLGNDATGAPTAAQSVNFGTILDALQTMGDAMDKLGVIVMHSQVYTNLMKQEQIAFVQPSAVNPFLTYYGKRVIIDDDVPVVQGTNRKTYTTYILGEGAFGYGEASAPNGTEVWRDPAAGNGWGEERLYSRKQLIIHPIGFSCAAAVSAGTKSPTLAQYGVAGAFTRSFERKNVPIAILKTNA